MTYICIATPINETVDITIIRYAQNGKIGKPNNLKCLGAIKPKEPNRITKSAKITYARGRRTLVLLIITLLRNYKCQYKRYI
jgi:hypothetical protein